MIAYVIKNKKGKFWQFLHNNKSEFVDEIYNAFFHYSKHDAEKTICSWGLKDCKVVEITIVEGDLERQLAIYKRALLKASKEAFGNKTSFVSSNYSKKITNSEEYAEYLIFETESEVKNEN